MNSKERVRRAIQHQEVDRVPATMWCVETEWDRLKKHFQEDDIYKIMEKLDIDTRIMWLPPYIGPELPVITGPTGEKEYTHPFGWRYIKKWNGVEFNEDRVFYPLAHVETMEQLNAFQNWPNPDHFDYEAVKRFCDKYQDKAIRVGWPGPYQTFTFLYPAEELYVMMVEDPDLLTAMLDRYNAVVMEIYERMFEAADGGIDYLWCADDYGTQRGLLFSPDMWEQFFRKYTVQRVELTHKYNAFYMQHSCGAVRDIIPKLISCGVDALEPLQKVKGMEVDGLKADFGSRICFQGGVDTQHLLPFGTPEEVQRETEYIIETMNVNGGYILAPSQDFEGDVPIENILALYEARKKFL